MKKRARIKEISRFNEKKGQTCLMRHREYFIVFKVAKERKNKKGFDNKFPIFSI